MRFVYSNEPTVTIDLKDVSPVQLGESSIRELIENALLRMAQNPDECIMSTCTGDTIVVALRNEPGDNRIMVEVAKRKRFGYATIQY